MSPLQRAAVALFIFNRPHTTRRVFQTIAAARPPHLFVIADGPRADHPDDVRLCREARAVVERVDWPCEVLTRFSDRNLGCELSITGGLDWVFSQVEQAIILEDDCLPDPSFYPFCEELLARYRDDERIHMIRGSNFLHGRRFSPENYHFSRLDSVWGWATWARAWRHYDITMRKWPELRDSGWLERHLPTAAMARDARSCFDNTYTGRIRAWEYQWVFAGWLHNAVVIVPETNLVTNIGFGEDATGTRNPASPFANLPTSPMLFPLRHPAKVEVLEEADAHEWARLHPGLWQRLKGRLLARRRSVHRMPAQL